MRPKGWPSKNWPLSNLPFKKEEQKNSHHNRVSLYMGITLKENKNKRHRHYFLPILRRSCSNRIMKKWN
jgi:hypothetical protein